MFAISYPVLGNFQDVNRGKVVRHFETALMKCFVVKKYQREALWRGKYDDWLVATDLKDTEHNIYAHLAIFFGKEFTNRKWGL